MSRQFDSPIHEVYAAVQRVFPRNHLVLVDSHGEPLEGGKLLYALPSGGVSGADVIVADLATRARVEKIHLRLLPVDQGRCIATLSAPLGAARRGHLAKGAVLAAGGGIVGGWAVGALGAALAISPGIAAAPVAAAISGAILLGFGAGGGLGIVGSRAAQRSGRRRGVAALERLVQAVGIEVRGLASEVPPVTHTAVDQVLPDRTRSME